MNGRSRRGFRAWWLGPLLAVALAACATSQVKDIADPALAGLPQAALPDPAGSGVPSGGADAAQRIETFIQTHPEITPTTLASLRIRQGVFYLDQQQPDRAAAAFEAADLASLVTPRDQALKEVAPDLVWWSRTAPLPNIPGVEMKRTAAVMESLSVQIAKRRDSPDIRDYLAEVRAWVGLKYFAALSDRGRQKAVLEDTIDQYATIFTAADLQWLCTPGAMGDDVAPEDKRRRLRARPIIARAEQSAAVLTGPNRPSFHEPVMQALIAPTSSDRVCVRR
jgi:hypothetical protein